MAVIKIFDSRGTKSLVLAGGNSADQEYDTIDEMEEISASEDTEAEE